MIFYSCVLNKTLHDALHAYTLRLLFLVHLCLFASVDSSMHMRPPTPPPPPPPPHFITFDDLFPGAVEGFAPLLKSTEAELLSSFAEGRAFLQNHDMLLTTSGVHVWFIVAWQTWGKTIVSDPAGIFMSSAYKADFGYYGKSSKNSWNWRYAAWLLRVSLVFQRSEIFLNFATQPSLLPSPPPALLPRSRLQICSILSLSAENNREKAMQREEQGLMEAAPGSSAGGWRCLKSGISVAWFPDLECGRQERNSLSSGMLLASDPPPPFFSLTFNPFLLLGLGRTYIQGSCALSSFLLFLWALL